MSILGLFNIGRTAIAASQTALTVSGNNIANVNTPGYSKQDVVLTVGTTVQEGRVAVGSGVTVAGIRRSYDRYVTSQLLTQRQNQGKSSAMDQAWGQVEAVMNEANGVGLSSSLNAFFNSWQDLAANPSSETARSTLLWKTGDLAATMQNVEGGVLSEIKNANNGISDAAQQVSTIAADIAQLNTAIASTETQSGAGTANDLRDQRDQKLDDLAKLVDFTSREDSNGMLTVTVGMRTLVSGSAVNPLTTAANSDGNQDLMLDGINVTDRIQAGELGGLIASRDTMQQDTLVSLRKLAAAMTVQINQLHQAGTGLDGSTGLNFFNPLQVSTTANSAGGTVAATITNPSLLSLDEYAISFDTLGNYTIADRQTGAVAASGAYVSGNTISLPGIDVTISGPVNSWDSFTVSPLTSAVSGFGAALTNGDQIAAAATAAGLPGDNANASLIAQLADTAQAALGNTSFSGYYDGIVSSVGTQKQSAGDNLTFDNNLYDALKAKRDSISGVSLDEEAANLVLYQRSYEAGARVISIADQLLQTLLNL